MTVTTSCDAQSSQCVIFVLTRPALCVARCLSWLHLVDWWRLGGGILILTRETAQSVARTACSASSSLTSLSGFHRGRRLDTCPEEIPMNALTWYSAIQGRICTNMFYLCIDRRLLSSKYLSTCVCTVHSVWHDSSRTLERGVCQVIGAIGASPLGKCRWILGHCHALHCLSSFVPSVEAASSCRSMIVLVGSLQLRSSKCFCAITKTWLCGNEHLNAIRLVSALICPQKIAL